MHTSDSGSISLGLLALFCQDQTPSPPVAAFSGWQSSWKTNWGEKQGVGGKRQLLVLCSAIGRRGAEPCRSPCWGKSVSQVGDRCGLSACEPCSAASLCVTQFPPGTGPSAVILQLSWRSENIACFNTLLQALWLSHALTRLIDIHIYSCYFVRLFFAWLVGLIWSLVF